MKQQKKINMVVSNIVGLTALRAYVANANMEVGQVTVRHGIFGELIVQVRMGKGLEDAKAIFDFCFNNRGQYNEEYVSPLPAAEHDADGLPIVTISPRLADEVYKRVCRMAITEENVLQACEDLITCGRMYQELTIDACKKMYDVNIPYGNDMARMHLKSRDNTDEDFNIVCNWKRMNSVTPDTTNDLNASNAAVLARIRAKKGQTIVQKKGGWMQDPNSYVDYILDKNPSETFKKNINGIQVDARNVCDFMHDIRIRLACKGVDFAKKMMEVKQEFDPAWLDEITKLMNRKEAKDARDLGAFFHDGYRTVNTYQTSSIKKAQEEYPNKSMGLDEHIKGVKKDTRLFINALSNQFRIHSDRLNLTDNEKVQVLMDIVLADGKNSNYAQTLLPEEFFKYVLSLYQEDSNVPKYTEDKLRYCQIPENTAVTFHAGRAVDAEGNKAYAMIPLEGDFLIHKNEFGHLVAARAIDTLVQAPEKNTDQLLFITKSAKGNDRYTSAHIKEITADILDKEVQLAPYSRKNKGIHDSFFCEGKEMGHFRAYLSEGDHSRNAKALLDMYQNKIGTVTNVISSKQNDVGNIAIVLMEHLRNGVELSKDVELIKDRQKAGGFKFTMGSFGSKAAPAAKSATAAKKAHPLSSYFGSASSFMGNAMV